MARIIVRTSIDRLLETQESSSFEVKRVGKHDQALKTVVAFANSNGGLLVLGVEDPGKASGRARLYGLEEKPEAFDELKQQLRTRIEPDVTAFVNCSTSETVLREKKRGTIGLVHVRKSNTVHCIVNGGTYARHDKSNRQLSAEEITRLSFRRGGVSAATQPVDVDTALLDTAFWRDYRDSRKLTRDLPEALKHTGLSTRLPDGSYQPTRAAVLLFAEEPSGLLDSKCTIRVFHYQGDTNANLVRPPVTVGGPLIKQIRDASDLVLKELASGVQVSSLGFKVRQRYPERVIIEAITNAVLHRDYSLNRDIHVRIFGSRIVVVSPGDYPGNVTAQNIARIGTNPRNRILVDHIREFPHPPNLDAGEGVPVMFDAMRQANLFPPQYMPCPPDDEVVSVLLFNNEKPTVWEQVCNHLDEHRSIGNKEVRALLTTDVLTASKQLKSWVDQGVLVVVDPSAAKAQRRYRRPNEDLLAALPFSDAQEGVEN